jgi:hypothetical protein
MAPRHLDVKMAAVLLPSKWRLDVKVELVIVRLRVAEMQREGGQGLALTLLPS